MSDILKAILKITPAAKVSVNNEDFDSIQWHDGTTPISKENIEAKFDEVDFDTAIKNLRVKRNQLLVDTDYLALSDQTLTDEMKTYRQELRDITNGLTTKDEVDAVTFPTKPE